MAPRGRRQDQEGFGEVELGHAQADNPPDAPDMLEPDASTLDTDVEDADLFLGFDDEDEDPDNDDL